eukprot:scaffold18608_cov97-Isochrysis_galbana.AAC.8
MSDEGSEAAGQRRSATKRVPGTACTNCSVVPHHAGAAPPAPRTPSGKSPAQRSSAAMALRRRQRAVERGAGRVPSAGAVAMPRAVAMADSRDSAAEEEGDAGEAGTEEALEGECVGEPVEQPAPTEPPPHLLDAYTLNHTVPIERLYIDEANGGQGTHYRYSRAEVQAYVDAARAELSGPSRFRGPSRGGRAAEGRRWLMNALSRLPVLGMSAAVFGAIEPWAEALLLASGAASVTTYEHNKLTYDHPALFTASVEGLAADHARGRRLGAHQLALSLSAFDHDGLGRHVGGEG